MRINRHTLFVVLRTAIPIALLVYLGYSGVINWSALGGLATAWPLTLAALLLLLAATVATAWRFSVVLKPRALHLSLAASVRLALMCLFFNACLPGSTGGDLVRVYYASQGNPGRRTEVITVIVLDRAAGMFALLIWPLLVVPLVPQLIASNAVLQGLLGASATVTGVMLCCLLIAFSRQVRNSRPVVWALTTLPMGNYAERVIDTLHAYRHDLRVLVGAVCISLLAHTLTIGVTLLVALAINPAGFAWQMAELLPLGFLANALPITPGGLGVGEAAFSRLFAVAGLSGGAEILLGWRMLTILMGLSGLIFYLQQRGQLVHQSFHTLGEAEAQHELLA